MAQTELLEKLVPDHWESQKPQPGSGTNRVKWLQQLNDVIRRPVMNRGSAATNATATNCTGAIQSTGIGLPNSLRPLRYGEFTIKARVTFNINSTGPAFVYVYRTLGAIPANGAAPGGGDVIVGGDAFTGGPTSSGVNQSASFSFIDTGLDKSKNYQYYLAVKGPNATVHNLVNNSQLFVLERA